MLEIDHVHPVILGSLDNSRPISIIKGDNIQEILDYCIPRVRPMSQEYYANEIANDLESKGYSWIDNHAGLWCGYKIILTTRTDLDIPEWFGIKDNAAKRIVD